MITTYSELQTSVTSWLSRTNDTALIALYPDFITLAEAKFNRSLRTRDMEASTTVAASNGVVALPADFLEIRRLYIDGSTKKELEYLTPETFYLLFPSSTGNSKYYTIEGANILLADQSTSSDVKILYYQKIPALSGSNTFNWLLTAHPDLYLAAVLSEAYGVIKNDAQEQKWYQKAVATAESILNSDKKGKYSGSAMRIIGA
jgi:hypothetical protein